MVRPIYNESNTLTHHQRLYYLYDSLGNVSVVTGENGLPLQNYTYSPYGSTMNVEYDPVNNLRFVGRYGGYHDDDTGLTYFWHRWYSDEDGRWVSRDPLNIKGGLNLFTYTDTVGKALKINSFQYAYNNPVYWIDANGLCPGGQPVPVKGPRIPESYCFRSCFNECIEYYKISCNAVSVACGLFGVRGGVQIALSAGGIGYLACMMSGENHCRSNCKEKCNE
jgi:RHS repeat-associated protein